MSADDFDDDKADEQNRTRRREDTVEFQGPFGVRVRTRGKDASLMIIMVLALSAIGYVLYEHHRDSAAQLLETKVVLTNKMDEMVYILSLPQEERDRLNIAMPDTLRQKIGPDGMQQRDRRQPPR